MSDDGRPAPRSATELSADSPFTLPGFFDAMADGRLLGIECSDCGAMLVPPRPACFECGSREVHCVEQPREGHIYTYSEVRRPAPAFEGEAPFTVAVVELDSGARLTGRVDVDYDDASIGMRVRFAARAPTERESAHSPVVAEDWPLHVFEPL